MEATEYEVSLSGRILADEAGMVEPATDRLTDALFAAGLTDVVLSGAESGEFELWVGLVAANPLDAVDQVFALLTAAVAANADDGAPVRWTAVKAESAALAAA